jgi:hypothetical protein
MMIICKRHAAALGEPNVRKSRVIDAERDSADRSADDSAITTRGIIGGIPANGG